MRRILVIAGSLWMTTSLATAAPADEAGLVPAEGLQVREQNGISYVSGGFGDTEQEQLEKISDQFNLKVTLATENGAYMGDTVVHIADASGNDVAALESQGPLLLMKVPAGRYTLRVGDADLENSKSKKSISVAADGQTQVTFYWDKNLAPDRMQGAPTSAGDAPIENNPDESMRDTTEPGSGDVPAHGGVVE